VATTRGSVEQRQARLKELQTELQQSSAEQDKLLQQQAEKRSRLNVLEQLQGSHEGFSAGAVAALRKSQSVIGSLADRIRVPDQYVIAIENALGHNLQLVLTEQPEAAQQILSDLANTKAGAPAWRRCPSNTPMRVSCRSPAKCRRLRARCRKKF
jgi:chromosome segregation protein